MSQNNPTLGLHPHQLFQTDLHLRLHPLVLRPQVQMLQLLALHLRLHPHHPVLQPLHLNLVEMPHLVITVDLVLMETQLQTLHLINVKLLFHHHHHHQPPKILLQLYNIIFV